MEGYGPLAADPQLLRGKPTFMVATQDYIVKMKSKSDAMSAFPQMASAVSTDSFGPVPEPILAIPAHLIVSVFQAESSRPQFGIEIWWKSPFPNIAFCSAQFFFAFPRERDVHMATIHRLAKAKSNEFKDISLVPFEVEARIRKVFAQEEPNYQSCKLEIFPVIRRATVNEDGSSKSSDKGKKGPDAASWYLAVGRNLCYFFEVAKGSELAGQDIELRYQTFGLVALESFRANWSFHEERIVLFFREPFNPTVTLELASKFYRQIVLTFLKVDRFLKPCWPQLWQTMEVFRVTGLPESTFLIPGENFGSLKRTLDAYLAAYRSQAVEWEVDWKTPFAPEFRLLPPKEGSVYSNLQLLAVFRALRYNDYFHSISLRDIDLSGLWNKIDPRGKGSIPYLSRSCLALAELECSSLRSGSLLHQEIHGLAFCSENIRQIDFTNCFRNLPTQRRVAAQGDPGLQILTPLLDLLKLGLTKCNRVILSGNPLGQADLEELFDALSTSAANIQALDVSRCGLSDRALRDLFEALFRQGHSLQYLDASGNLGRVHASLVCQLVYLTTDLRSLNVSGIIMGEVDGPLFSLDTLQRFRYLEEIDLSNSKVSEATLCALEDYLEEHAGTAQQNPQATGSPRRRFVFNNCGINGRQAARLIRALGQHGNVHLFISGNYLEYGIDDLAHAIALTRGPKGLHIDMVEFREEHNYIKLMKALAINKSISYLSLVGTAPTPLAGEPCSDETCLALEWFFQTNKSVRFLDISGYTGKLDEGQLGKGFGRCLRGLGANTTLTHLRIRNQNLHDDVGTIGNVLEQNSSLLMLDCQDNSWNLTSIQFLVKSLKKNKSIVEFPFSTDEYQRVWSSIANDVKRKSSSQKKAALQQQQAQEALLKGALDQQLQELKGIIQRNKTSIETERGQQLDFDDSSETGGVAGWPSLEFKGRDGRGSAKRPVGVASTERSTVKSSTIAVNTSIPAPYHVRLDEAALESPTEAMSPLSEAPTTPELHSPSTPPDNEAPRRIDIGPDFQHDFSRFKLGDLDTHQEE